MKKKVTKLNLTKIYEDYKIEQTYEAISDKTTLVNMTNHSYFNLSGNIKRPVTECYLKLDSDEILELDETCVPTGRKINVESTPFDFRKTKLRGKDIDKAIILDSTNIDAYSDRAFIKLVSKKYYEAIEDYKKEVDKCQLLCSNCHAEEHEKMRNGSVTQ